MVYQARASGHRSSGIGWPGMSFPRTIRALSVPTSASGPTRTSHSDAGRTCRTARTSSSPPARPGCRASVHRTPPQPSRCAPQPTGRAGGRRTGSPATSAGSPQRVSPRDSPDDPNRHARRYLRLPALAELADREWRPRVHPSSASFPCLHHLERREIEESTASCRSTSHARNSLSGPLTGGRNPLPVVAGAEREGAREVLRVPVVRADPGSDLDPIHLTFPTAI